MTFPVYAIDCATDPGAVTPGDVASDNIPSDCGTAAGVQFTVTENGQPLVASGTAAAGGRFAFVATQAAGVYTTDASGKFELTAQIGSTVVITEDASTDPLDYAPRQNPITLVVTATEDGTVFVNLPQTEPSPSASPSESPSAAPSASPSAAPSASPPVAPSANPSTQPAASPSAAPSPQASASAIPAQLPNTGSGGSNDPGFGFRLGQWLVALLTIAGFGSAGYGLRRRQEMRRTFRRPHR